MSATTQLRVGRKNTRCSRRWVIGCVAALALVLGAVAGNVSPARAYPAPAFTWSAKPAEAGGPVRLDINVSGTFDPSADLHLDLFQMDLHLPAGTDFHLGRAANCTKRRFIGCPARSVIGTGTAAGFFGTLFKAKFNVHAVRRRSRMYLVFDPTKLTPPVSLSSLHVWSFRSRLRPLRAGLLMSWLWAFGFAGSARLPWVGFQLTSLHLRFKGVDIGGCPSNHRWPAGVTLFVDSWLENAGKTVDDPTNTAARLESNKSIACR